MQFDSLLALLQSSPNANLQFVLPDHQMIPDHFHVTEVGRVDRRFIDCGGTRRSESSCQLQVWVADDYDHRLAAGKLAQILKLATSIVEDESLPVHIEYGPSVASLYQLSHAANVFGTIQLHLAPKQTDCLAKDACGIGSSDSGCCGP